MPSITAFVALAAVSFSALVAGNACVIGGPVTAVRSAHTCCYGVSGSWHQKYPNQGICVMKASLEEQYEDCVAECNENYDATCIVCDETTDCGLS